MGVTAGIAGWRRAFLDTALFIYYIEQSPRWLSTVEPIFAAVAAGRLQAVTSGVTLLEVLVIPLRRNDLPLAERYEALFRRSAHLDLVSLDAQLMRDAAGVRAHTNARTPDAIQIAAGLRAGCDAFVTNDRRMPTTAPRMPIVQLADLAGPAG